MKPHILTALTAILALDNTIPKEKAEAVIRYLLDKDILPEWGAVPRSIRIREVQKLFGGVTSKTLRCWAAQGKLVPVYGSNSRRIGYTEESVRELLAGRRKDANTDCR